MLGQTPSADAVKPSEKKLELVNLQIQGDPGLAVYWSFTVRVAVATAQGYDVGQGWSTQQKRGGRAIGLSCLCCLLSERDSGVSTRVVRLLMGRTGLIPSPVALQPAPLGAALPALVGGVDSLCSLRQQNVSSHQTVIDHDFRAMGSLLERVFKFLGFDLM